MKQTWTMIRVMLLVTVGLFAACSSSTDEVLEPDVVVKTPPTITLFTIEAVDAAQPTAPAETPSVPVTKANYDYEKQSTNSVTVAAGQSVKLRWQVSDATKIELRSSSGAFATETVEAAGEKIVGNLQGDDRYTLKASNDGGLVMATVSVTVATAVAQAAILDFGPEKKEPLNAGESTKLCFAVQPKDADVKVTDVATGTTIALEGASAPVTTEPVTTPPVTSTNSGALATMTKLSLAAELPTVSPVPASPAPVMPETPVITPAPVDESQTLRGCTVAITPAVGEQQYLLSVTDQSGNTVTREATIVVVSPLQVTSFTANGQTELTLTEPGEVRLAWDVTPDTATVTLDPTVCVTEPAEGQEPLAEGECYALLAKDVVTVTVDKTTTYTLTATDASGQSATAQVTITVEAAVAKVLTLSADTSNVFAGETVTLSIAGDAKQVEIVTPSGARQPGQTGDNPIVVTESGGYYVVEVREDGAGVTSNAVTVNVRSWGAASGSGSWSAVTVDPNNMSSVVAGKAGSGMNIEIGTANADRGWSTATVDFGALLTKAWPGTNPQGLAPFAPIVVNGFAFDTAHAGRVLAGVAGGVALSDAAGSWSLVDTFPQYDRYGAKQEHASCDGRTQKGLDGSKDALMNLSQVCDLLVLNGRLLVGTDSGTYYLDNYSGYLSDKSVTTWHGGRKDGQLDAATNLQNVLTHELVNVQTTVYAATHKGIYRNLQNGDNNAWEAFGAEGVAVYALTATEDGSTLYAGTVDGKILRSDGASSQWETIGTVTGPVYSVAASAKEGAVLVGTASGVQLLRTAAGTSTENAWVDITASMNLSDKKEVYSVSIGNDGKISSYAAATANGVYSSSVSVVNPAVQPPVAPEPPTVTPTVTTGAAAVLGQLF